MGFISGFAFAPTFFFPCIFLVGVLINFAYKSSNAKQAFVLGYAFGVGHFITGTYWISNALFVELEKFWWLIPFSLLLFPAILGVFIGLVCLVVFFIRKSKYIQIYFASFWIFFEWLRSWIFTGFPWNLAGYSLSFSLELIQLASIVGVIGLSYVVVYISSGIFYLQLRQFKQLISHALFSIVIIGGVYSWGSARLADNPTEFTDISVRLVQGSIPQESKWSGEKFIFNIKKHMILSMRSEDEPIDDIIIWPESAIPTIIKKIPLETITNFLSESQILITGAVDDSVDNEGEEKDYKLYVSMHGINAQGDIIFDYHKNHLVPFGEYIPFNKFLPIKKITHGFTDYSPGKPINSISINSMGIKFKPLICYEVAFADEVKIKNKDVDAIITLTNDAWYGNSFGPYQNLYIAQMRSIENGLPLLRSANNGISAVIDSLGRFISMTKLNEVTYISQRIPKKITSVTKYSKTNQLLVILIVILITYVYEILRNICIKYIIR